MNPVESKLVGFLALGIVILGSSFGNVFLKLGARASLAKSSLLGIVNGYTIVGILSFGIGLLAYTWALRQFELHAAQIIVSLQYACIILASVIVLGEQIALTQWIGIGLIVAGIFVCTR